MNYLFQKTILPVLLLLIFLSQSCKKVDDITADIKEKKVQYSNTTLRQLESNQVSIEMINITAAHIGNAGKGLRLSNHYRKMDCAVTTIDSSVIPYQITIDFGQGCVDDDGKTISGVITGTKSPSFEQAGDFAELNLNSLEYDGKLITGTLRLDITNGSSNFLDGVITTNLSTNYEHGKYKLAGTNSFNIHFEKDPIDDEMGMLEFTSGGGSGTDGNGINFTQQILIPLRIPINTSCNTKYFLEGEILFQAAGFPDKNINYGNGSCDKFVYVTENGVTIRETLD